MTPQELADRLIGTCETVVVEEELDEGASLDEFDSLCFCCQSCNWWAAIEELHNEEYREVCDDCWKEEEDEE